MSIKESLIKNYKKAGGSDPAVMESTSKLIENTGSGAGGGLVFIPFHYDSSTTSFVLEMTWQEIFDGMASGTVYAFKNLVDEYGGWSVPAPYISMVKDIYYGGDSYNLSTESNAWYTDSASGYPSTYIGD